jgi:hypothetical protein
MLNRPPANDPDDDEVIEANEPADMPPPAVGPMNPRPVNPGPVAEPPAGPP